MLLPHWSLYYSFEVSQLEIRRSFCVATGALVCFGVIIYQPGLLASALHATQKQGLPHPAQGPSGPFRDLLCPQNPNFGTRKPKRAGRALGRVCVCVCVDLHSSRLLGSPFAEVGIRESRPPGSPEGPRRYPLVR